MKRILLLPLFILMCKLVVAQTYIIGVQAPITGSFASEGQGINNAIQLLVAQTNAAGGINGDTFKVVTCDDQGNPQNAVICAKTLVDAGAKVVIGSYSSTATEASQAIYAKAGVIQTSDATANNLIVHAYPTYFRNSFNDNIEGNFTADYFVNIKKYKRIVILGDFSAFSTGLSASVINNIKALKGNIVYTGKITSGDNDFRAILTKIKALNPDVIYYSGYFIEGALLRSQEVSLGIKADFVGGNSNDNPQFLKIAGSKAKGSYLIGLPLPQQLDSQQAQQFVADYAKKYNSPIPSIWTITNADGLLTVFAAMKAIKTNDPILVAKYIHGSIRNMPCLTGYMTINNQGEREGNIYQVSQIQSNLKYKVVYH
ncbi:MAG: branched-chain amino acid ABC transporter substrate-binding protein [Burkholderiales bacterium]|nr:branched-chain amino acid ABC transporter substrate-binding protein [Burkholderiales bacterium]